MTDQAVRPGPAFALRSPALRLIGNRLATAIPVLFGVTFLTFAVIQLLPGDAAQQLLGINATQEQVQEFRDKLNLDDPFLVRYLHWLGDVLTGNLGNSLASDQPVTSILERRAADDLPAARLRALHLARADRAARAAGGAQPGRLRRPRRHGDEHGRPLGGQLRARASSSSTSSRCELGWLPAIYTNDTGTPGELIKSLTLPAIAIGFPLFCFYTRLLRADILEQMQGEDYVVTAKAKGVGPWRVLVRHALPNSLFGLLTIVALNIGTLIGATVIIEQIFAVPGIGHSLLEAINNRDVPVVEGIVLVLAVVVVIANLLADVLYAVLDPRIRYGRSAP